MTASQHVFRNKAPSIMAKLIADFDLSTEDAAAILGNIGHECAGFTSLQEIKPTVEGSRGGFGWVQWTGPRRKAYEAYCKRNGLDPASDKANYGYLWVELSGKEGSEKNAIPRLKAAIGLDAKVEAFEMAFLRAGVKHYPERIKWAKIAMEAWDEAKIAPAAPIPAEPAYKPKPTPPATSVGLSPIVVIVLALLVAAAIVWFVFLKR